MSLAKDEMFWTRFWTSIDNPVEEFEFLPDPEAFWTNLNLFTFDRISYLNCLVLVGNPGIGKSKTTKQIYQQLTDEGNLSLYHELFRYANFEKLLVRIRNSDEFKLWETSNTNFHLFLDGLDEVNSSTFHHEIVHFVEDLSENQRPRLYLRVTCRSAQLPVLFQADLKRAFQIDEKLNITYKLVQLREHDVWHIANRRGIDANSFILDVKSLNIQPLAAHPITLRMLVDIYDQEQTLPKTKSATYAKGCRKLLTESDPRRIQRDFDKKSDSNLLMDAARQLAAIGQLCNRTHISPHNISDSGSMTIDECVLEDASKTISTPKLLYEICQTALFNGVFEGGFIWAHKSYAEFLAAEFLNKNMSLSQIKELLTNPADPKNRITTQLRETSAWLSSLNQEVFDWILDTEPMILFNSDSAELLDTHKAQLVKRYLEAKHYAKADDGFNITWSGFSNLSYDGLGKQLASYLTDKTEQIGVRENAMRIAFYCNVDSIDELLIELALDPSETISIRNDALATLKRPSHKSVSIGKLRSLVFPAVDSFNANSNEEMIARALHLLWYHNHITADELFSKIHIPLFDEHRIGGPHSELINEELGESLAIENLPIALNWINNHTYRRYREIDVGAQNLIAVVLTRAWDNFEVENIRSAFTKVLWTRLLSFHRPLIPSVNYYMNDAPARDIYTEIMQNNDHRYQLILSMLENFPDVSDEQIDALVILVRTLIKFDDIHWLLEQLHNTTNTQTREHIASMIGYLIPSDRGMIENSITPEQLEIVELVYRVCQDNDFLNERFQPIFTAIELKSDRANSCRQILAKKKERDNQSQEQNEKWVDLPAKIRLAIDESQLDSVHWIQLDQWLRADSSGRLWNENLDYQDADGWKSIFEDQEIVNHIIAIALIYLHEQNPYILDYQPRTHIAVWTPAAAGYRAFILLGIYNLLNKLPKDVWSTWSEAIVFCNTYRHTSTTSKIQNYLLEQVFRVANITIVERFQSKLESGIHINELSVLLNRFHSVPSDELNLAVSQYLQQLSTDDEAFFKVLEFLIRRNDANGQAIAIEHLSNNDVDLSHKKRIIPILAKYANNADWWDVYWKLLNNLDIEQHDILQTIVDDYYVSETHYLTFLSDEELIDLHMLAVKLFPYHEDKEFKSGFVPDWYITQEWRDKLLKTLAERGSKIAVDYLTALSASEGLATKIQQYLDQAWEIYREASWVPHLPKAVLQLAEDNTKRNPQNGQQLLNIIMENLHKLQKTYQTKSSMQSQLWDEQHKDNGSNMWRPVRQEELFANRIAEWLDDELSKVIINREAQGTHPLGNLRGDRTDIKVEIVNETGHHFTVIIEVKCCWYSGNIYEPMQTQLVDRYMQNNATCQHGLYLVGYFGSEKWDSDDPHKNACSRKTIEKLSRELEGTRDKLRLSPNNTVEVFVFNASI